MKILAVAALLAASALISASAGAQQSDDAKWIAQCMVDNKGGASDDVVAKYCSCMNNKMSSEETRSITEWEKANPNARKACEAEAGWK